MFLWRTCRALTIHTSFDVPECVNHNTLTTINLDDLGSTVRRTAVIDEPGNSTSFGRVDDRILVNTEQITTTNSALEIPALAHICHLLTHFFTDVFDDHIVATSQQILEFVCTNVLS